ACIVFNEAQEIISKYSVFIHRVQRYESGKFYRRELPCILRVLEEVNEKIDLIITDSFVWLDDGKRGLGARLYEKLKGQIPVIGVAKTFFRDAQNYKEVFRGKSSKPLYVSSAGIDLDYSADFIRNMKGRFRIPDLLKEVDRLSRT
ncbi:MAG: endonuclease V, partial [Bacillota bacterium]|nr:endonuclease V [Bacillota bacterium]